MYRSDHATDHSKIVDTQISKKKKENSIQDKE